MRSSTCWRNRRKRTAVRAGSLALLLAISGSASPAEPDSLAARIRTGTARRLAELPDYVCEQVVERWRVRPNGRATPSERFRLEIAYIGGQELLASPGAGALEQAREAQLMPGGTAFSGLFAAFLKHLVSSSALAWTQLPGEGNKIRFACPVPRAVSGYVLSTGDKEAIAGYIATITADTKTLQVRELELQTDDASLGITAATTRIHYAPVRIGARQVTIPNQAEIEIRRTDGILSQTRVRYEHCRAYVAESKIDFAQNSSVADAQQPRLTLPAGLRMRVRLQDEVLLDQAAKGDPVRARLTRDLVVRGRVVARSGAAVMGRIEQLEVRASPLRHALAVIVFSTLDAADGAVPMAHETEGVSDSGRVRLLRVGTGRTTYTLTRGAMEFSGDADLVGSALLVESPLVLPAGLELELKITHAGR